MIRHAIERGASDIHVVPERGDTRVLLRIDGRLHETERVAKGMHPAVADRWKLMADLNVGERRAPQEGRLPVHKEGRDFDLRVTVLPTLHGERVTARVLDLSGIRLGLDRLDLGDAHRAALRRMARQPSGLIAAGGQRGSGRTTLMYSLLLDLRDGEDGAASSIMTVEHPVEMELAGISQTAANPAAGIDIVAGLRAVLRSDPDVVFCGRTEDEATARLVAETAWLGHLVLTTVTANSALGVITRLRGLGVDNYLLARTLTGAIGLRMVRRPGLRGRLPLVEILEITDDVRRLIAEDAPVETLWRETFGRAGGSFRDDARDKIARGLTTEEEVERALLDYPHLESAPDASATPGS
jgi:type II secretory ATPase GspE/PulE/Tfp pilus assembly ATPase PilB-like protein